MKIIFLLLSFILFAFAEDLGFVDNITINERELDSLDETSIEFYRDDFENGQVKFQGLLESENSDTPVEELFVEITTDGGVSWSRATGHEEWEWSFTPELETVYEFSLRIVEDTQQQADNTSLPTTLTIAGFTLTLDSDVSMVDGKITGSGNIDIPYLSTLSSLTSNIINVDFSNLTVSGGIISLGDITYSESFVINTPIADVNVDQIVLSPTVANNKIIGNVVFKDMLSSSFGTIPLPTTGNNSFTSSTLNLSIPFQSKTINIWEDKGVELAISEGSLDISYTLGDSLPSANFNIPTANFKLGELLKYTDDGSFANINTSFGSTMSITLPRETNLLDSGIKLPSGTSISLDLADYSDPKLSFTSSVDLQEYAISIVRNLNNATISANISKTGLNATVTGDSALSPITIMERGSEANNVKLTFTGDSPSFSIGVSNSETPTFAISGVTPNIHFGNLLTDASGGTSEIVSALSDISSPTQTISISTPLSLLGSKIKLPNGFTATVNLEDLSSPAVSFNTTIDFTEYNNVVAKQITGASIEASISRAGFSANVTANKPAPIMIYAEKDVKLMFKGTSGPSFSINVSGSDPIPQFHISSIDAELDFGTLLRDINDASSNVLAAVDTITQDGNEVLKLTLPSKVKIPDTNLAFEGIIANLSLAEKTISITSSLDLSGYGDNAILQALTGSTFEATVSTSGFNGSITVVDELPPIDIWAEKDVKLNVTGTPSIGIALSSSGVDFDFGQLNASIDFGDLLKSLDNSSVAATLGTSTNSSGEYTVTLNDKVKLLGSQFALENTTVGLNINNKSLTLASTVDLAAYNKPILNTFNGASFNATISTSGFTGSFTKSGALDPIVIYAEKAVSLDFTESPTVGITIANSGVEFEFSGGSAKLNFGTLLEGVNTTLASVEGENGVYSWGIGGEIPLAGSNAKIKSITNGRLDINDITDPKISFGANVDLSGYGGVLASVDNAQLNDVMISKSGFSASLSANLGTIDIWSEKNVKLLFDANTPPTMNLSLSTGGVKVGFSNLTANLDFGDLLPPGSIANIVNTIPSGGDSTENPDSYSWSIDGEKKLFSKDIYLSSLGGSIDISDFSNPSITLSAMVDFSRYDNPIFEHVTSAQLSEVTISKSGFSGTLATNLTDITIWQEKEVKVTFDESAPPTFTLNIDSSGLKLGAENLTAGISLGSLLNNSNASLNSVGNNVYEWSIAGTNPLGSTGVTLSGLNGSIDFNDLKDPSVNVNATADVSSLGSTFQGVTLQNGLISKNGFKGDLSAQLNDISIYKEGEKEIMLKFATDSSPTVNLSLTRDDFSIGVSDLQAKFDFTGILDGQELSLTPIMIDGEKQKGVYAWGLEGSHEFLNDSKGIVPVTDLGGTIDLSSWSDPKVSFHTSADFSNYNLIPNVNLGTVAVTNAVIQKTKIEWNLSVEGASANLTILELGEGADDDVRVSLENISATVGTDGTSFDGGDGKLHLGKLFDGNKQATLTSNSSDGLKSYTFAFSEDVVYRQDSENFITFQNLSGTVAEQSSGGYKVSLGGEAVVHSSVLSAMSIDALTVSGLEISSSGFVGTLTATWTNYSINILDGQAALVLNAVGVTIDTAASTPISLSTFDGNLDLDNFFDGEDSPQAGLEFVDSSIKWDFGSKVFTLKDNQNYIFKNLSGTLNLASINGLSLGLAGTFGYKDIENDITLSDFVINRRGVAGTVTLNGEVDIVPDLKLTQFSVTFAGAATAGTAGLTYSSSSFLGTGEALNLGLSATADQTGLTAFAVNTSGVNTPQSIDVAGFAKLNFTKVTANPDMKDFWISLDGTVQPQNDTFGSTVSLEFEGLKISSSGVTILSAGANTTTSGTEAKLGPLKVSVTKVGIGFQTVGSKSLFYLNFAGSLALKIAEAEADVTLYSDKSIKVNKIGVDIHQSGLKAKGDLEWFDKDSVYGDGFKATLDKIHVAATVEASGLLQIGQIGEIFYWRASFEAGAGASGMPLGASGLTMYTLGGGIAHNMSFDATSKKFTPSAGATGLIISTNLGTTSDNGLLWNGDIKIIAGISDGTLQSLSLNGTSWILSKTRSERPSKRKIIANITYAAEPKSLQVYADVSVEYKKIKVIGKMDVLVSSAEKHVFIGSDSDYAYRYNITTELGHVKLTIFGQQWDGFFMADDDTLALGAGLQIDKEWKKKWTGPDPTLKLILHAGAKAMMMYRPTFQMNADVGVEVTLKACYGGCLTAGADVLLKLATPNPDYLWAETSVSVPGKKITFNGYIYGEGDLQEATEEPTLEIFDHLEPTSFIVGRMPIFKVYSTFVDAQPIEINFSDVKIVKTTTSDEVIPRKFALDSDDERRGNIFIPQSLLAKNTDYRFTGTMRATYMGDDEIVESITSSFSKNFKTRNDDSIRFTDFVNSITPLNNAQNIHEDEGVKINYNPTLLAMLGGVNSSYIREYLIELYDSDDNKIYGVFTPLDNNTNYIAKFKSAKSLRIYRYCVNSSGEIRETFLDGEGHFFNPFNGFNVDMGGMDTHNYSIDVQAIIDVNRALILASSESQDSASGLVRDATSIDVSRDLLNIEQDTSGTVGINTVPTQAITASGVAMAIPTDLRMDKIMFTIPEALGTFVMASRDAEGNRFSYYRSNEYKIRVKHAPTNTIAYSSKFQVQYNNVPAEAKRKVEQMQENIDPTFTVSLDVNRIGSSAVMPASSSDSRDRIDYDSTSTNDKTSSSGDSEFGISRNEYETPDGSFFNEVRVVADDGLSDIGVYDGIKTRIIVNWILLNESNSLETIEQVWSENDSKMYLPGIVMQYSVNIQYISQINDELVLEMPMRLITGDSFDSFDEMMTGNVGKAAEMSKDVFMGKTSDSDSGSLAVSKDVLMGGFSGDDSGGFAGSSEAYVPLASDMGTVDLVIDYGTEGSLPVDTTTSRPPVQMLRR